MGLTRTMAAPTIVPARYLDTEGTLKTKKLYDYIDGFADLVVPTDPEAFQNRLFAVILGTLQASRVTLFAVEDREVRLAAGTSISQDSVDHARRVWDAERAQLEAGRIHVESVAAGAGRSYTVVVPVCAPRILGLLSVELAKAPQAEDLDVLKRLTHVAAIAFREAGSSRVLAFSRADEYLRGLTPNEIMRDKLLIELHANEWNIARVARRLGVTRRTIYLRLERFGIKRVRILKAEPRKRET